MEALDFLKDVRSSMGPSSGMSLVDALYLYGRRRYPISVQLDAFAAVYAYCDPFDTETPPVRLLAAIRDWCHTVSLATQFDALEFAIEYLGGHK